MSKRDNIYSLRRGREFISYAKRHGATVVPGGNHQYKVVVPGCKSCPIPDHPGDLGVGLRSALIKAFRAMGIAGVVAMAIVWSLM
jgi:hypothetical protein